VIQRVQDGGGRLQRVDATVGNGGVGHLAVHRDLELQAAVVGRDHLIAEARGHRQIGLGQTMLQQPAWAEFAAKFFVVGEVQFNAAFELRVQ
jgi:hypothetical protein